MVGQWSSKPQIGVRFPFLLPTPQLLIFLVNMLNRHFFRKKKLYKDTKLRVHVKNLENTYLIYKYILYNTTFSLELRNKIYLLYHSVFQRFSKTKITNFCILTGRSRSVLRKFRLSRLEFKHLSRVGSLNGITRAM